MNEDCVPYQVLSFFVKSGVTLVSVGAGYWIAVALDKRRSKEAIISQIEMIRDTIREDESDAAVKKAHEDSVPKMKEIVFQGLPKLSVNRQRDLRIAWARYRDIRFGTLEPSGVKSRYDEGRGVSVNTPIRVVLSAIQNIEDTIG